MAEIANAPHDLAEVFRGEALPQRGRRCAPEAGDAFAWRFSLKKARARSGPRYFTLVFEDETGLVRATPEIHGDAVLGRKDFPASYHLAERVGRCAAGVTHVIRGDDLRDAAHLHVLLQKLLDLPQPIYRHHRLVLDQRRPAPRQAPQRAQRSKACANPAKAPPMCAHWSDYKLPLRAAPFSPGCRPQEKLEDTHADWDHGPWPDGHGHRKAAHARRTRSRRPEPQSAPARNSPRKARSTRAPPKKWSPNSPRRASSGSCCPMAKSPKTP